MASNVKPLIEMITNPAVTIRTTFKLLDHSRAILREAEAPICLPNTLADYREMMGAILNTSPFDISAFSPACLAGMDAMDLIASRHFRTPVALSFWFSLLETTNTGI